MSETNLSAYQLAISKGAKLYDWQIQFLEAFSRGYPCLAMTCNGAGKTSVLAGHAVDWFFTKYPRGWLVATSSSFNQLQNQTWPAIETKLSGGYSIVRGSSPLKIRTPYSKNNPDKVGGEGVGFATNDAGRAEGWHPKVDGDTDPVMILIDEGKTVPDSIWTAFDRCTAKYFMGISSAGPPMGRFFDGFHSLRKYYYTITVDYTMCPHIDINKVNRLREQYGEDSYEFRSIMKAMFTDQGEEFIMTKMQLEEAMRHQPKADTTGEKVAFFDFARGGDENTFTIRHGNKIRLIAAWKDKDTVQAVRKFIRIAKENGLQGSQCWGDADGLGGPMIDTFKDEGFRINEFHGNAKAHLHSIQIIDGKETKITTYLNLISEAWIQGARRISKGDYNLGSLDPSTIDQLTNRKFEWNKRSQMRVESKDDMRNRGVSSPDRGDGVMCVTVIGSHMVGAITESAVDNSRVGGGDFSSEGVCF